MRVFGESCETNAEADGGTKRSLEARKYNVGTVTAANLADTSILSTAMSLARSADGDT